MSSPNIPYNSQLVSYLLALYQFHHAETGSEDAFALYHLIQETDDTAQSKTGPGPALPALGHALAGAVATASSKVLLYPLELVTTRLQVQRQLRNKGEAPSAAQDADAEYHSILDAAKKIYKHEGGLKAFYTGCGPDVGKGIADSFLFFLAYTFLRQYQLKKDGTRNLPVFKQLSVGVAAGVFARFFTTPISNIVTRQQTAALVAARDPTSTMAPGESDKLTVKDIALQIRAERGIQGFWAGYSATVLLTLNPAITFAVDNLLKSLLPKSKREHPPPQLTFLVAALSKAIASTITYPVTLAKSRAQAASTQDNSDDRTEKNGDSNPEGAAKKRDASRAPSMKTQTKLRVHQALRLISAQYAILLSLRKIYRDEGLSGLYSGLEGEVLKGFLSHGLTMMVKDRVHIGVIQLYYLLLKLTKRWPQEVQQAQKGAQAVAADAKERVGDVGEKVSEGARHLVQEGRKAAGGD
ncbi:hypothetical protein KC343_g1822 [Hortaea werneckii]|uniref:Mitochondrial carrier n=1 Tax=Hortaea werneckii TaxID=91943 RepID=A0A3M7GSZ7_HORWE|nr:hypothetical protein KC323_g4231 [Hortaea werneckii]KAI7245628.1 hypothetical protein KC352_g14414 [Hortaea werneckii]KAI7353858.1 hypothetical protein KC320_g3794 [Hortaea werneckii]KAI7570091.1 hypothetical protein KC317_g2771 [Hortaea werneckii]KAI7625371.1 hypothetical protein KC346_g1751 [Hortaea werneckii]